MTALSPQRLPFALGLLAALAACASDEAEDPAALPGAEPIVQDDLVTAASDAGLTTLVSLAETAGLVPTLQGEGPYTAFAPTNEAFDTLPQGLRDSLLLPANRPRLERLLQFHVVPGRIETNMLPMSVQTMLGAELTFEANADGFVVVDGEGHRVGVVTPDVNVSNGVVHVLDGVLMPPPAEEEAGAPEPTGAEG